MAVAGFIISVSCIGYLYPLGILSESMFSVFKTSPSKSVLLGRLQKLTAFREYVTVHDLREYSGVRPYLLDGNDISVCIQSLDIDTQNVLHQPSGSELPGECTANINAWAFPGPTKSEPQEEGMSI